MSTPERLAQAFATQVRQWSQRCGAGEQAQQLAARAALEVSLALGEGHTCLSPGGLAHDPAALLATGVVGTPSAPGSFPLILDDQQRLYLHRYFDYEVRLAACLHALCLPVPPVIPAAPVRAVLAQLLQGEAVQSLAGAPDWQTLAAALALQRRFTVISGGPGTGKTSTVVRLLGCLLALDPHTRIVLAAPTGKAAARMQQAVQSRADTLPPALRDRLPDTASTLHRLLGAGGQEGRFRHHRDNPLLLDVLVVDEASMLDLALATHLLEALPPGARLILLGDKDQLAAVQSGAVFAELSRRMVITPAMARQLADLTGVPVEAVVQPGTDPASGTQPEARSVLDDSVMWFTRQFRFAADSPIGRLAAHVRDGATEAALGLLASAPAALQWMSDPGGQPSAQLHQAVLDGFAGFFGALEAAAPPEAVFAAFDGFRVLCALRNGPWGVLAFNEHVTRAARARMLGPSAAEVAGPWYVGRPVLVVRNDALLGLFNGDIGIALPDAEGELQVCFPQADGSVRRIPPVRLPEHETAYAMTIHKSQGSEFDAVAVVLPAERAPLLSRELLYTGVTRARQRVLLQGTAAIVQGAINAPTVRSSGLLARLAALGGSAG